MSSTSNWIGFSDGSKLSSRVLKPPGGGSSIMFDEPDGFHYRSPKLAVSANEKVAKSDSGMSSGSVSPTPSGSVTPPSDCNSGASSIASTPAPSSPQSKAPPMPEKLEGEPKTNGSIDTPFPEISKIKLDDVPVKANISSGVAEPKSPASPPKPVASETATTPNSKASTPDTKGRLFGESVTPGRVIKDRMKSSIFVYQDESPHKPPSPEVTKVEQVTPTPPRQRIPPGGFSTKLW